ncbi:iron-containing alcohol dehydrogenase [Enterococcus avium]|uniref:iron-containing alcohol dehydrogenase n=1 Tax=Enterococcus avium TaxID=33945 RepID=UPI00288F3D0C|nr:iron-containing alcohol dehydrogenase [Enterococcus avium]MDT2464414.1 iron-containing alcohol dehydrogenase [Enterococcus avium]MDT2503612.1 iron-containing alcohol dehydrogenase [Enterococcus avium]
MTYNLEQHVKVTVTQELEKQLIETLMENSYRTPMIVIDSFLVETKIIKKVLVSLKENSIRYLIFDKVTPNPSIEIIDNGAQIFLENKCDSIVAIGGGSVIDAARGINIVRYFGGSIKDYVYSKPVPEYCRGLISVPTTSGTGSELSNALVATDSKTKEKLAILADNAVSEFAILCPDLVKTLPKQMTIMTGLDVFSHASEAYTSNLSSPVVDSICEKVMFLVVRYLPKAVNNPDDLEARERMMVASSLGGWILNNGGTHLGHSLAHVIGAKMNIPHGMACAYSTPATLMFTAAVSPKKIREIGNILDTKFSGDETDMEIGKKVAEKYKFFRDNILGLSSFEETGIKREDMINLTSEIVNERFAANCPFEVTEELVISALKLFG